MKLFISSTYNTVTPPSSTYEAEAVALFDNFTNTYGSTEKDLINDLIIDLKTEGIWDKLDHFYLATLSGKEEQLIDWKNPTQKLTDNGLDVTQVPYKGLAPQTGTYYTGIIPSAEMDINSSFYSFKCGIDFDMPNPNYILGADANYRVKPIRYNNLKYYDAFIFNSYNVKIPIPSGSGYDNTVVLNRTASNATKAFINNQVAVTSSAPSVSLPTTQIKIGGEIADRGNTHNNFVQHFACGDVLTDAEALSLTTLIDTFANAQKALDTDYTIHNGIKVTVTPHTFIHRIGNECLYFDSQYIYYSTDGGATVASQTANPNNTILDFAHIFDNGKIIFSDKTNKIYKTTTSFTTVTEMTPTKNGSTYVLHTPANATFPGNYYRYLGVKRKQYLSDGTEIIVWGNYCNVFQGASPSIVWYSFGDEIKVAYEFGQNPYITDMGTGVPTTGGTLLGDATNTILTRHIHSVDYRPNSDLFYVTMGDYDRSDAPGTFYESHVIELDYDITGDSFTPTQVLTGSAETKVKIGNMEIPDDGFIYYSSDAISVTGNEAERGFFKTSYANLGTIGSHTRFYLQTLNSIPAARMIFDSLGNFLSGYAADPDATGDFPGATTIYSDDLITFVEETLPIPGAVFYAYASEISPKVFHIYVMTDYYYNGNYSIIVDFN